MMRGERPFVRNIAPELDALIYEACQIAENATLPSRDMVDRLREAGKAWDAAGRPLISDDIPR